MPRSPSGSLIGRSLAQPSAATCGRVIEQARATPPGEKLTVVVLGESTNVASALLIAPAVAPRLRAFLLGTTYRLQLVASFTYPPPRISPNFSR
jgi:hypothetical protein